MLEYLIRTFVTSRLYSSLKSDQIGQYDMAKHVPRAEEILENYG
jgi:hypothetical protein